MDNLVPLVAQLVERWTVEDLHTSVIHRSLVQVRPGGSVLIFCTYSVQLINYSWHKYYIFNLMNLLRRIFCALSGLILELFSLRFEKRSFYTHNTSSMFITCCEFWRPTRHDNSYLYLSTILRNFHVFKSYLGIELTLNYMHLTNKLNHRVGWIRRVCT